MRSIPLGAQALCRNQLDVHHARKARGDLVLPRGAIIRVVDERASEPEVDLLVMEHRDAASGFAIMVASGYKAGIASLNFPAEARKELGISASWLGRNWTHWYSETAPDEILVADQGYRLR